MWPLSSQSAAPVRLQAAGPACEPCSAALSGGAIGGCGAVARRQQLHCVPGVPIKYMLYAGPSREGGGGSRHVDGAQGRPFDGKRGGEKPM